MWARGPLWPPLLECGVSGFPGPGLTPGRQARCGIPRETLSPGAGQGGPLETQERWHEGWPEPGGLQPEVCREAADFPKHTQ